MKLGTDNKRNTVLAAVLLVIAGLMFLRMIVFSNPGSAASRAPSSAATAPSAQPLAAHTNPKRAGRREDRKLLPALPLTTSLDPRLRTDLLAREEQQEYQGNGRNIFAANSEPIPKPVAPGLKDAAAPGKKFPLSQPPAPPPINLKFFGYANQPGEAKRVFLSQPDGNVLLAHEGDMVGQRYRIVHIGPSSVEIEDVLSNNRQSIPLTQS